MPGCGLPLRPGISASRVALTLRVGRSVHMDITAPQVLIVILQLATIAILLIGRR